MINFKLILNYILPFSIGSTVICGIIATAIGSIIGSIIGAIRRRVEDTVYVTIIGCFLGSMLTLATPFLSQPGVFQSWGTGGGLGSLVVIFAFLCICLGGLVGGLVTSTIGFKLFLKLRNNQALPWLLAITWLIVAISHYFGYTFGCSPNSWNCSDLGFES